MPDNLSHIDTGHYGSAVAGPVPSVPGVLSEREILATGQAIALGLCMYAMHLLASLLGAPSFAVGRRSTHPVSGPTIRPA